MNEYVIPKVFSCFYRPSRYKIAYGGRGSGKSWAFALMLLRVASVNDNLLILCLREIQNSINDSVYRLLVNLIDNSNEWEITKTEIINVKTRSRFIFKGLYRNIQSIKSLEGANIAWIEEAHSVSQESWDFLLPTIRAEHSEIWATFNPDQEDDPVYSMFIKNTRDNAIVQKVNYTENKSFPDALRLEMEYDKKTDYEKYLWIWEGNLRTQSDAQIFKGKFFVEDVESGDQDFYYGVDWGFSNDPTTMIRCYVVGTVLYIDQEAYGLHVDIDKTPALFDTVPGSREWVSRADNSRPETISYMKRNGYPKMRGDEKLKIEDGISYIRGFERIVIHPRCKHTIEEFKLYSYHVDRRTGEITPKIEDKNNHMIDACFVGETKIKTIRGDVKISDIKIGDYVLTRKGFRKVNYVFDNGVKTVYAYNFSTGESLTCTDTHSIMQISGKKEVKNLSCGDIYYTIGGFEWFAIERVKQKLLNIMVRNIAGILKAREEMTGYTTRNHVQAVEINICIKKYIKKSLEKYLKGFVSTIKMVTLPITVLPIFLVLAAMNIFQIIHKNILREIKKQLKKILIILGILQKNGIKVKKGENGIADMQKKYLEISNLLKETVTIADQYIATERRTKDLSFVQTIVNQHGGGKAVLMMLLKNALSVRSCLHQTNMLMLEPVVSHVGKRRVYDISVEEYHEYYADGILVSNCRYALYPFIKNSNSGPITFTF